MRLIVLSYNLRTKLILFSTNKYNLSFITTGPQLPKRKKKKRSIQRNASRLQARIGDIIRVAIRVPPNYSPAHTLSYIHTTYTYTQMK